MLFNTEALKGTKLSVLSLSLLSFSYFPFFLLYFGVKYTRYNVNKMEIYMKHTTKKLAFILYSIFLSCFVLTGCGGSSSETDAPKASSESGTLSNLDTEESTATTKGSRDNTSIVLVPEASGSEVHSCDVATIDASNTSEGYLMAKYTGSVAKVKFQIKGPDGNTYTYNLHGGDYEVFPLTAGDGTYSLGIHENVEGTTYSTALTVDINVTISNSFGPYLYPNQYVDFNASSLPVGKAVELSEPANNDLEVIEQVYNYIIDHFTYDYDKAANVVSGYLPVVDSVYTSNTGICFDYAAVMATMLRSQNIPTRLEVGYVGEQYHAWISSYIEDIGWVNGIIEFDGTSWNMMDPTFASTSKKPKDFITNDSDYLTKYVY